MTAAVVAWGLAITFFTSALEKAFNPHLRDRFRQALAQFVPVGQGRLNTGVTVLFLLAEVAVLPLLFVLPNLGLQLLLGLSLVVLVYALIQWYRGALMGECPCGGLWAASGRNLLLRNGILTALALSAFLWAPQPLPTVALWYALGGILLLLLAGGFAEAVRVRLRTR